MKKTLVKLFILTSFVGLSQAPKLINYQGVARDASGVALSGTPLSLTISVTGGFSETHNVTSNAVGIFTLHIGGGSLLSGTFGSINWGGATNFINVTIDAGSGPMALPSSQLVSVPYALYADKVSGSAALPTGTVTGQTLYWDATSTVPVWKVDNNLTNDGNHVGIGLLPVGLTNKLHVVTGGGTVNDRAAIFGYRLNADTNSAGVRGVAIGVTPSTGNLTFKPISGGNFLGLNSGTGSGVGATGQGFSTSGDAVGVMGIGTSSSSTLGSGVSVGVYGTALGPLYKNSFAAVFDRGKVMINDSLFFPTTGNPGDILMKLSSNAASWTNPGSIGPWTKSGSSIFQNVLTDKVGIGTNSPGANLTVFSPSGYNGNDVAVISQGNGDALQINRPLGGVGNGIGILFPPACTGTAIAISNAGSGPSIYISGNASYGIFATTTGTAPTIFAQNTTGSGPSVKATKSNGGNAGVFEITPAASTSTSSALLVANSGKGTAIHAVLGPASGGSLNSALLLESGHMTTHSPVAPITQTITSLQGGGSLVLMPTSTDVAGKITINIGGPGPFTSGLAYARVVFNKPYITPPIVVITPVTASAANCQYFVSSGINDFTISLAGLIGPGTTLTFNYIVIEAK